MTLSHGGIISIQWKGILESVSIALSRIVNGRTRFPLHRVFNGDPRHSDHRPAIVECGGSDGQPRREHTINYLKFEARWLEPGGEGLYGDGRECLGDGFLCRSARGDGGIV